MLQFGFSLYPEYHELEVSLDYIDLLARYGASRLFISFLQVAGDFSDRFQLYRDVIAFARTRGMAVIADISPSFIEQAGWEECLLEQCRALGLAGIRLDESLSIAEMVVLTHNDWGLKIELNMSTDRTLIGQLQEAWPIKFLC